MKGFISKFFAITTILQVSQCNYFKNWHQNIQGCFFREYSLISENEGYVSSSLKGIGCATSCTRLLKILYFGAEYNMMHSSRSGYIIDVGDISRKESLMFNSPNLFKVRASLQMGGWSFLYEYSESDSMFTGEQVSYFSGEPGVAVIYVSLSCDINRLWDDDNKYIRNTDLFLGIGSKIYSGSFQGVYSIMMNSNIGFSIYQYSRIKNNLNNHDLARESNPEIVFELCFGRYTSVGSSLYITLRNSWRSFIWSKQKSIESILQNGIGIVFVHMS